MVWIKWKIGFIKESEFWLVSFSHYTLLPLLFSVSQAAKILSLKFYSIFSSLHRRLEKRPIQFQMNWNNRTAGKRYKRNSALVLRFIYKLYTKMSEKWYFFLCLMLLFIIFSAYFILLSLVLVVLINFTTCLSESVFLFLVYLLHLILYHFYSLIRS